MKIIKCIAEKIENELDAAEDYIQAAIKYKSEHQNVADTFFNLSLIHMDNINKLHNNVTNLINTYKNTTGEPPAPMMAVYEFVHERQINKSARIKQFQELYKSGGI